MYPRCTTSDVCQTPREQSLSSDDEESSVQTENGTLSDDSTRLERSQARAQKLHAIFEWSTNKDYSLNKNAVLCREKRVSKPTPVTLTTASSIEEQYNNSKANDCVVDSSDPEKTNVVTPAGSEKTPSVNAFPLDLSQTASRYSIVSNAHTNESMDDIHHEEEDSFDQSSHSDTSQDLKDIGWSSMRRDSNRNLQKLWEIKDSEKISSPNPFFAQATHPIHSSGSMSTRHFAVVPILQNHGGSFDITNDLPLSRNHVIDDDEDDEEDDYDCKVDDLDHDGDDDYSESMFAQSVDSKVRSLQDQKVYFQIKALNMQSRFEQADHHDFALNSNAVFNTDPVPLTIAKSESTVDSFEIVQHGIAEFRMEEPFGTTRVEEWMDSNLHTLC